MADDDDDEKMLSLGDKKKKKKIVDDTIRLNVKLFEPTKDKFPEFDFCQLVKEQTGKDFAFECPLEESEERKKLNAIAKKFEEKYGPKRDGKGKKFQFGQPEDYMDLGMGYDKSDSFIDDGENYDELIPSTLTTLKGGFYVNHGTLQFKDADDEVVSVDEDSNDSDSDSEPVKKKVRLKSNSEGSSKPRLSQLDAKKKNGTIPNLVKKRRQVDKQNEIRRKNMTPNQKAGSALVKNSRVILAKKLKKTNLEHFLTPYSAQHVDDVISQIATGQIRKINTNPVVDSNIESTINELLETSVAKRGITGKNETEKEFNILLDASKSDSESEEMMKQLDEIEEEEENLLRQSSDEASGSGRLVGRPPTLQAHVRKKKSYVIPDDIKKIILKIQKNVCSDTAGKLKWNPTGDKLLLVLFCVCITRELNQFQRSVILNDLATRIGTSKILLIARYKQLQKGERSGQSVLKTRTVNADVVIKKAPTLEELFQKLEHEVNKIMPRLETEYLKAAEITAEKKLESLSTSSLTNSIKSKNIYSPRRKFEWTKETKSLLSSIVRLYHEKFLISSSLGTSVTFDKFIDENVVPRILRCFPPMWMTGKPVMKMIREVYPSVFEPEKQMFSPTTSSQTAVDGFFPNSTSESIKKPTNSTSTAFTIDSVLSSNPKCSSSPNPPNSNRSSPGHTKSEDVSETDNIPKNIHHFAQIKQINDVKCYSSPTATSSSVNVVSQVPSSSKVQNLIAPSSNTVQTKKVIYPIDLPDNLEKTNSRVLPSPKSITIPSKSPITVTDQSGNKDKKPQEIICNPIVPHNQKVPNVRLIEDSRKMSKNTSISQETGAASVEINLKPASGSNELFYGVCKKNFPAIAELKQTRKTELPSNKIVRRAQASTTLDWRDNYPTGSGVGQKSPLGKSIENVANVDSHQPTSSTTASSSSRLSQDNGKQDFKSPLVPPLVEKGSKQPHVGILKPYVIQQTSKTHVVQQSSPGNMQTKLQNYGREQVSGQKTPSLSPKFDIPTPSPTMTVTPNRSYMTAKSQEQFISKQIKSEAMASAASTSSRGTTKVNVEFKSPVLSSSTALSAVSRSNQISASSNSPTTSLQSPSFVNVSRSLNVSTQERKSVDNNSVRFSPYKPTTCVVSQTNTSSMPSVMSSTSTSHFMNYPTISQFYMPNYSQPSSVSYANSLAVLSAIPTWPATYSQEFLPTIASHEGSYRQVSPATSNASHTSAICVTPTIQTGQDVRNFNSNYRHPNQLNMNHPTRNSNDTSSRNPR